jgi:hypothetical protein
MNIKEGPYLFRYAWVRLSAVLFSLIIGAVESVCHSSCSTCSGSLFNQCITCPSNDPPSNGACCPTGQYYTAGMSSCDNCHWLCKTCKGPLLNDCLSCSLDSVLNANNTCTCRVGSWGFAGTCKPCDPSCEQCLDSSLPTACISCAARRVLASTAPSSCKCMPMYYLDTQNKCQSCYQSCRTCKGPLNTDCLSCETGATLQPSGECICSTTNSFQVTLTGACFPCHYSCKTCTGPLSTHCLTCYSASMYDPSTKSCKCPDGQYALDTNGLCSPCHVTCKNCNGPLQRNCTSCYTYASLNSFSECVCNSSSAMSPTTNKCELCHMTCLTCTLPNNNSACSTCKQNMELWYTGQCVCNPGYTFKSSLKACIQFTDCHPSCSICSDKQLNGECTQCHPNALLTQGQFCACSHGFYQKTSSDYTCSACNTRCKTCLPNQPDECTSCHTTYSAILGSNILKTSCYCSDGPGYYINGGGCSTCDPFCKNCESWSNFCGTCKSALAVYNSNNRNCECPTDMTINPTTSECEFPSPSTDICIIADITNLSKCINCDSYATLNAVDNSCTCKIGFYRDTDSTPRCKPCGATCAECDSNIACTNCRTPSSLNGGTCRCPSLFFMDTTTGNCLPCHSSCLNCSSIMDIGCITCGDGRSNNLGGTCECSAAGFYRQGTTCKACHPTCASCIGALATQCTSCKTNAILLSTGECKCKQGYNYDSSNSCVPCANKCLTCNQGDPNTCATCKGISQLPSCVYLGSPPLSADGYPTICHPTCLACKLGNSNQDGCTQCKVNAALSTGVCSCNNMFFMDASGDCQPCMPGCNRCISFQSCLESNSVSLILIEITGQLKCNTASTYYDGGTCTPCPSNCQTCKGGGVSDCLTCIPDGSSKFVNGKCECNTGYALDLNFQCKPCDFTCLDCFIPGTSKIGESTCSSCRRNDDAVYSNQFYFCNVPSGYTRSLSNYSYPIGCPIPCKSCTGGSPSTCTSCFEYATPLAGDCVCNTGYGRDQYSLCVPCHKMCTGCRVSGYKQCETFNQYSTIGPNDEFVCISSAYYDESTETCKLCHPNCLTCRAPGNNNCISCLSGAHLESNICSPPIGSYLSKDGGDVKPCSTGCKTCLGSDTTCTSCNTGEILLNAACICGINHKRDASNVCIPVTCHPSCATCDDSSDNNCKSCKFTGNGYLWEGKCYCKDGYYMNTIYECVPCDLKCVTCLTSSTYCTSCKVGVIWNSGNNCTCPNMQYTVNAEGYCTPPDCGTGCAICQSSTQCSLCKDPEMTINNGICTCPNKQHINLQGRCRSCHYSCATCAGTLDSNCLTCDPSAPSPINGKCTCVTGKFMNQNGECIICHKTCASCIGMYSNQCLTCYDSIAILTKLSGNNYGECLCPPGTAVDISTGKCVAPRCHPSCATCKGLGVGDCLTCTSSAMLQYGRCICQPGMYMIYTGTSKGTCSFCHFVCQECIGPAPYQCSKCMVNAILSSSGYCICTQSYFMAPSFPTPTCKLTRCHITCLTCGSDSAASNNCSTCKDNAVLSRDRTCICVQGYYMNVSTGTCSPCHARCLNCVGPEENSCTLCKPNSYLENSGSCSCIKGYYYTSPLSNQCSLAQCDPSCETCWGVLPTECLTCRPGKKLTVQGTCECTTNSFIDPVSQNCLLCHSTCHTCIGPNELDCETCLPNAVLTLTGCRCLQGYYFDPSTLSCQMCDGSCQSCSGSLPTNCKSCREGMTLILSTATEGECKILSPYTSSNGLAVNTQCHLTCLDCSAPGPYSCTKCRNYATLLTDGSCQCISDMKMNPLTGECQPIVCHKACKSCAEPSSDGCIDCEIGMKLQTYPVGACGCRLGYAKNPKTSICEPCYPTCLTCNSTSYNSCLTCQPNLFFMGDSSCQCPFGKGFSLTTKTCENCYLTCRNCLTTESNSCITCKSGNYKQPDGSCKCKNDYTLTPRGTCSLRSCDYHCLTCSGSNSNQCLTCRYGAYLSSEGTCECRSGVPMDKDGQCLLCHPSCAMCSSDNLVKCISCYALATLQSDGTCKCKDGYYFDSQYSACLVCHLSCLTCSGPSSNGCTSCREEAMLEPIGSCRCNSQINMANDGSCRICPTVCKTCRSDGRCNSCYDKAQLDSKNGCKCIDGYYMAPSLKCELCHDKCAACVGPDELDCISCKPNSYYDFFTSSCISLDGNFYDPESKSYSSCNKTLKCLTCNSSLSCMTCSDNYNLLSRIISTKKEPFYRQYYCEEKLPTSAPITFSVSIIHDQLILELDLPQLSRRDTSSYLQSVVASSLINITRDDLLPLPAELQWTPIHQSEYEWMRGIVRFQLHISSPGVEAFNCSVSLTPSTSPQKWSQSVASSHPRSLQTQSTPSSSQPQSVFTYPYLFPAYSTVSAFTSSLAYYLGVVLQTVQILVMIFLVGVRPLSQNMRTDPKNFWVVGSIQWMQLWMLLGYTATELRGGLDAILLRIADASLRWISFDGQISFVTGLESDNLKQAVYLGKFTSTGRWPHIVACLLIPSALYFFLWIISLVSPQSIKAQVVAMKLGLGMSFLAPFIFLSSLNLLAVLRSQVYSIYTMLSLIYSILLLGLLLLDIFLLKRQLLNNLSTYTSVTPSSSIFTHQSTTAITAYDLHLTAIFNKGRIIKKALFDDIDFIVLASILLGTLGTYARVQSILLLFLSIILLTVGISSHRLFTWKGSRKISLYTFNAITMGILAGYSYTRRDIPIRVIDILNVVISCVLCVFIVIIVVDAGIRIGYIGKKYCRRGKWDRSQDKDNQNKDKNIENEKLDGSKKTRLDEISSNNIHLEDSITHRNILAKEQLPTIRIAAPSEETKLPEFISSNLRPKLNSQLYTASNLTGKSTAAPEIVELPRPLNLQIEDPQGLHFFMESAQRLKNIDKKLT